MAFKLDSKSIALMEGVHPDLVKVVRRAAELAPFPFKLTEGIRTLARQKKLKASGASQTLNSRHIPAANGFGHAVDIVPWFDTDGDGDVDSKDIYAWPSYYKLAPIIKRAAKDVGVPIEWGGDWKKFKDGPHWQLPWKDYPSKALIAEVRAEVPITNPTEKQVAKQEASVVAVGGTVATASIAGEPLLNGAQALMDQQSELSSGDIIRILVAVAMVGLTIYLAVRRARST